MVLAINLPLALASAAMLLAALYLAGVLFLPKLARRRSDQPDTAGSPDWSGADSGEIADRVARAQQWFAAVDGGGDALANGSGAFIAEETEDRAVALPPVPEPAAPPGATDDGITEGTVSEFAQGQGDDDAALPPSGSADPLGNEHPWEPFLTPTPAAAVAVDTSVDAVAPAEPDRHSDTPELADRDDAGAVGTGSGTAPADSAYEEQQAAIDAEIGELTEAVRVAEHAAQNYSVEAAAHAAVAAEHEADAAAASDALEEATGALALARTAMERAERCAHEERQRAEHLRSRVAALRDGHVQPSADVAERAALAANRPLPSGHTYAELADLEVAPPTPDVLRAFDVTLLGLPPVPAGDGGGGAPAQPAPAELVDIWAAPPPADDDHGTELPGPDEPTDGNRAEPQLSRREQRQARRAERQAAKAQRRAERRATKDTASPHIPGDGDGPAGNPEPELGPLGWSEQTDSRDVPEVGLSDGGGWSAPAGDEPRPVAEAGPATGGELHDAPWATEQPVVTAWADANSTTDEAQDDTATGDAAATENRWGDTVADQVLGGDATVEDDLWAAEPEGPSSPQIDSSGGDLAQGRQARREAKRAAKQARRDDRRARREEQRARKAASRDQRKAAAAPVELPDEPAALPTLRPDAFGAALGGVGGDSAAMAGEFEDVWAPPTLDDPSTPVPVVFDEPLADDDELLADVTYLGPSLREVDDDELYGTGSDGQAHLSDEQRRAQLEREAKRLGVSVEDLTADPLPVWTPPEEWDATGGNGIVPVVTPGDVVDHHDFDLPEPIPDRSDVLVDPDAPSDDGVATLPASGRPSGRWGS